MTAISQITISHVSEDILNFSASKVAVVTTEYSTVHLWVQYPFFFLLNNLKIYLIYIYTFNANNQVCNDGENHWCICICVKKPVKEH